MKYYFPEKNSDDSFISAKIVDPITPNDLLAICLYESHWKIYNLFTEKEKYIVFYGFYEKNKVTK